MLQLHSCNVRVVTTELYTYAGIGAIMRRSDMLANEMKQSPSFPGLDDDKASLVSQGLDERGSVLVRVRGERM